MLAASNRFSLMRSLRTIWSRWRLLWVIFLASLLLSGCVEYDVGVNFESQTHGEIVQHIQLGEQLRSFSSLTVQQWLDSVKRRTQQLGGKTQRISEREMLVTIPFNNGAELEKKFNQFFNLVDSKKSRSDANLEPALPEIQSHLTVNQNNWLFAIRNRLIYDLDMRSLGVLSSDGSVLVSPGELVDVKFSLNTPWGARTIQASADDTSPEKQGNQLVWALQPGQLNHLETVFWVPSPIGIGAFVIILLVAAGGYLKYQLLPAFGIGSRRKPTVSPKPLA
ncbi:DUF3153 domain-containing protein [Microcoleus sp. FACHB-672]|uniref:DUF3153 domain-containing protein n=1 Tax=Microcoleus sp. FACHB-672 TaxID=2692825 RepID=UPI001685B084|nr:DUF3153 domain-containing protein [Microcoleus sp. FACHB-672]MBD2039423.1 DUF3153 domain-containing protein [Microcoleus sp. FACHB-672]